MSEIIAYLEEGRLLRSTWIGSDKRGRRLACLLAVLAPECGDAKSTAACPASLLPAWFAEITPWMNDNGSKAAWPGMVRRYAGLAERWHILWPQDWTRLDWTARRIAVEHALSRGAKYTWGVECALELLWRAERGDVTTTAEFLHAEAAAFGAGAWALRAAMAQTSRAARNTAAEAASTMAVAAAVPSAVRLTETDAITAAILDAIEAAIVAREAARGFRTHDAMPPHAGGRADV